MSMTLHDELEELQRLQLEGRNRACFAILDPQGFTLKEICAVFDRPLNALSGRISELKRDRVLVETGERRGGCAVVRLAARTV